MLYVNFESSVDLERTFSPHHATFLLFCSCSHFSACCSELASAAIYIWTDSQRGRRAPNDFYLRALIKCAQCFTRRLANKLTALTPEVMPKFKKHLKYMLRMILSDYHTKSEVSACKYVGEQK